VRAAEPGLLLAASIGAGTIVLAMQRFAGTWG
jgi:hypothetical protein